jgi:N-acetylglucosaminyldiphosphoundecaprenol N-acetyl-beta-D-mannosaminyltransferase
MAMVNLKEGEAASPDFRVLGVRVHAVQIPDVIALMERWIRRRETGNYIAVTGMHGIMEAQRSAAFKGILNRASLVVTDGMPLVWLGRWHHLPMPRRVYGPELTESFCRATGGSYRHFFYGGAEGVANHLGEALGRRYGIQVVGTYCPPFRKLSDEEEQDVLARIRDAAPDVLWVGLSTPKQERWMAEHQEKFPVPVMVGVGAAFDFLTGRTRQAPVWMREHGLEWLFRLASEPRRLWRRYLVYGPQFVWAVALELSGIRRPASLSSEPE